MSKSCGKAIIVPASKHKKVRNIAQNQVLQQETVDRYFREREEIMFGKKVDYRTIPRNEFGRWISKSNLYGIEEDCYDDESDAEVWPFDNDVYYPQNEVIFPTDLKKPRKKKK